VDICCLTDFEALIAARGLDEHSIYYYVPSLLKHFTTAQINALIAPRPHLSLAGNYGPAHPPPDWTGLTRIATGNMSAGAKDTWQMKRYESGHFENTTMRSEIMAFLKKWL